MQFVLSMCTICSKLHYAVVVSAWLVDRESDHYNAKPTPIQDSGLVPQQTEGPSRRQVLSDIGQSAWAQTPWGPRKTKEDSCSQRTETLLGVRDFSFSNSLLMSLLRAGISRNMSLVYIFKQGWIITIYLTTRDWFSWIGRVLSFPVTCVFLCFYI